jgi:phage gpG-like protein
MNFSVVWYTQKIKKALTQMQREVKPCALTSMRQATQFLRGYIVKNKLSGQVLHRRSGKLAGSIMGTEKIEGGDVVGIVGSNLKYARIHELGGIIRPKNFTYLHFKIGDEWIKTKEVNMPKRSYIKPSLEESKNKIREILGVKFFSELVTKGKRIV